MTGQNRIAAEVLVIGGGPTGLALTLDLARRGIRVALVDRGLAPLPGVRAGGLSARMMEHLRRLGVAEILKDVAPMPPDWPRSNVLTTRLAHHLIGEYEPSGENVDFLSYAAERPQNAPSWLVETIMRGLLADEPTADLRFGWRFEGELSEATERVSTVLTAPDGTRHEAVAEYVVGADGANSRVRQSVGIRIEGAVGFEQRHTVEFRSALLRSAMGKGRRNGYNFTNADMVGGLLQQDATSLWTMHFNDIAPHIPTDGDPRELIWRAVGERVPIEWTGPLRTWRANAFYATTLVRGRTVLIGDAAHAMPPGGFGLHLGNSEAADLAWRLDALLRGWGGRALLDALDAERLPLTRQYVRAVDTSGQSGCETIPREFDADTAAGAALRIAWERERRPRTQAQMDRLATSLQDTLGESPLIQPDAVAPRARPQRDSVIPGRRLPHQWLTADGSIYDRLGTGLNLVHVDDAEDDAIAFTEAAARLGIPLATVRVESLDGETRIALVRPDHMVIWRTTGVVIDHHARLETATGLPVRAATPA